MTQPDVSALARKFRLDVDINSVWTQVKGRREFLPVWAPVLQDDSVHDDDGWGSQTKTGLDWSITLMVVRRHSPANETVYDPGQEELRAKSLLFGADGQAHIRFYDRDGGPEAYEGWAEVTWTPQGGDRTALELVQIILTGRGPLTAITNPAA